MQLKGRIFRQLLENQMFGFTL